MSFLYYVLCGFVCVGVVCTQLMREESGKMSPYGKGCQESQVNVAVLQCQVLQLLHSVVLYCNSTDCQESLNSEWREFFQPALQESLLAIYLNSSGTIHTRIQTHTHTNTHNFWGQEVHTYM